MNNHNNNHHKHEHAYKSLGRLLRRLDIAGIQYRLSCQRDEAISVAVAVPGERWEIELTEDGDHVEVEVERFVSAGGVCGGEEQLEALLAKHMHV